MIGVYGSFTYSAFTVRSKVFLTNALLKIWASGLFFSFLYCLSELWIHVLHFIVLLISASDDTSLHLWHLKSAIAKVGNVRPAAICLAPPPPLVKISSAKTISMLPAEIYHIKELLLSHHKSNRNDDFYWITEKKDRQYFNSVNLIIRTGPTGLLVIWYFNISHICMFLIPRPRPPLTKYSSI